MHGSDWRPLDTGNPENDLRVMVTLARHFSHDLLYCQGGSVLPALFLKQSGEYKCLSTGVALKVTAWMPWPDPYEPA